VPIAIGRQKVRHTLPACRQAGLHRDSFLAKVPGFCPVLRQVTPTNFITGPLGFMVY